MPSASNPGASMRSHASPQALGNLGRMARQIRKGKFDDVAEPVQYSTPQFVKKQRQGAATVSCVDCSHLRDEIAKCLENNWSGTALMLFGELSHDLLYYIRSRGHVEIVVDDQCFIVEKRGRGTMENFSGFLQALGLTRFFPNIKDLVDICVATEQVAEKVHLRTILVMFADLPSLFITWSPVKITRLLGSGGQRTIFEVRTRRGEFYALRPDTRDKELERMFVCLEAIDASHLFHIFEALEYEENTGRCHLFMPVMMELDQYFTGDRLQMDIEGMIALVHHTALQLDAMANADLVHRDVKPANILVYTVNSKFKERQIDTQSRPFFFLTDFGWSCEKGINSNGAVGGTKQYRDPYMYVIPPHPKHDVWCMGLALLFLINRATESNTRATMVKKIKYWQEQILTDKSEGAEFSVNDFTRWIFQWERMALGSPLEDLRRFRVGSAGFTADFRELERGCLDLRWEKRWDSSSVLEWTRKMSEKYHCNDVTTVNSFKEAHEIGRPVVRQ